MDQGKYTINIHENISFVVNIKQQIVFFFVATFSTAFWSYIPCTCFYRICNWNAIPLRYSTQPQRKSKRYGLY